MQKIGNQQKRKLFKNKLETPPPKTYRNYFMVMLRQVECFHTMHKPLLQVFSRHKQLNV